MRASCGNEKFGNYLRCSRFFRFFRDRFSEGTILQEMRCSFYGKFIAIIGVAQGENKTRKIIRKNLLKGIVTHRFFFNFDLNISVND